MGDLIILILVGLAVSALSRNVKARGNKQADNASAPPAGYTRSRPQDDTFIRPADVDLPGQTTMPIRHDSWTGESSEGRSLPEPDSALRTFYRDEKPLRPSEQGTIAERSRDEARDRAKVRPALIPELDIQLNANTLVTGVIFSEILNHRPSRRKP